jgi:cell division protein FtsB
MPRLALGGRIVKDIYEVLRKKQGELAQLAKQIEALQTAAEQLRSVAHLLDDDREAKDAAAGV